MNYAAYDSVPEELTDLNEQQMTKRVRAPVLDQLRLTLETIQEQPKQELSAPEQIDVLTALETIKQSVQINETEANRTLVEVRSDLISCLVKVEKQLVKRQDRDMILTVK